MSAVSDWVQTCNYFYPSSHHQNQELQQPIYHADVHGPNNLLSASYQPYYGFPHHSHQLQDTNNSSLLNLMSVDSNTGPLSYPSESNSQVLDVQLWSQLNAQGLNMLGASFVPAISPPAVSSDLDSINVQQQELLTVLDSWTRIFNPAVSPSLASSSSNAPSPSLSSSPLSIYTSLSPLPGTPSQISSSPSPLLTANASSCTSTLASDYINTFKPLSHKFAPRTSSILTRRQSQALALKSALAHANSSSPPDSSHTSSALQISSSSPLTCQVCKKQYANSSTLRRHLKIHAYANSAARSLSSSRSSTPFSDTGSHAALDVEGHQSTQQELQQQEPQRPQESYMMPLICTGIPTLSFNGAVSSAQPSSSPFLPSSLSSSSTTPLIHGYNPCSDPDIKKPECVGCNKAFARRDTVILHIKNQKRKWDLLNALLPTLAATAAAAAAATTVSDGACSLEGLDLEGMRLITKTQKLSLCANNSSGSLRRRGSQKHRRTHPYRMVEKLWQSTMQRKGVQLAGGHVNNPNNGETHETGKLKVAIDEERYTEDLTQAVRDEKDEMDDGWPSKDALAQMDSRAKLQWMMKMMVLPPCWKERKVRLFGAFGVLEEKVLQ
ncbi:hypothetical protein EC968_000562 [Mortierella alpina]|nr:hypothetical protein EC968_000562 [Mortierella alpina]